MNHSPRPWALLLLMAGAAACGTDDVATAPSTDADVGPDALADGAVAPDGEDDVVNPDAGVDVDTADADRPDVDTSVDVPDAVTPQDASDAGDGEDVPDATDTVTDGSADAEPDLCPDDPLKTAPGTCGCGVADEGDTDSDDLLDCVDDDDDGDGVSDSDDAAPLDRNVCADADADGCDDCASGTVDTANDGDDLDEDGICDARAGATFVFTTCGSSGSRGPDGTSCANAYAGTLLQGEVTTDTGYQRWTVPQTGFYRIEAVGASGGGVTTANPGGLGARVAGTFSLVAGDALLIAIGQAGSSRTGCADYGGGGGGGTFVTRVVESGTYTVRLAADYAVEPLLVAGGGAGANDNGWGCEPGEQDVTLQHANLEGSGDGAGGTGSVESGASGGGGFIGSGEDRDASGGLSFVNGATGGFEFIAGGFGGGGDAYDGGGCGGGYTGGSGYEPDEGYCSGGSSYLSGTDASAALADNRGDGQVIVYRIGGVDADGDGVLDWADPAPDDATVCGDSDHDTCDDCSVTGIAGSTDNDGVDSDGDGICDAGTAVSSWVFGTCGTTGEQGPGQDACFAAYAGTSLDAAVVVTAGYQRWVFPESGRYRITASGAQGGSTNVTERGGAGARLSTVVELSAGGELIIVVGQMGTSKDECSDYGGGGGGGTFVALSDEAGDLIVPLDLRASPLVVAGGGGGASDDDSSCSGQDPTPHAGRGRYARDGNGGIAAIGDGGAGGGWLSSGADGDSVGGQGFLQGARGGDDASYPGGFGGGADAYDSGGSGGGYTGGSTTGYLARGGYSYAIGTAGIAQDGANEGPGSVLVERLAGP